MWIGPVVTCVALVVEKEVLSGIRSHSEMNGRALHGFRCVAVKIWSGVYRVELHRTSPNLILYSGTRCIPSDEASRVNLHRDRKKAGYGPLEGLPIFVSAPEASPFKPTH